MTTDLQKKIHKALQDILIPGTDISITDAGLISNIIEKEGTIGFVLDLSRFSHLGPEGRATLQRACQTAVLAIPGVQKATIVLTSSTAGHVRIGERPKNVPAPPTPKPLPNIRHIIAVASGKGGVGKSTVAVNLAVALAAKGLRVGLVDADIYGPSVAHMMQLDHQPEIKNNLMIPMERYGVACLSMGAIIPADTAMVWRGPMVSKALAQLFRDADWSARDVLVVDMPPGTGDIHLSIAQNFTLSGALLVSTPQEVALLDVRKAINMFEKVHVPILGLIENMSYLPMPDGSKNYIFGTGAIAKLAHATNLEVLTQIPLEPAISLGGDIKKPVASERGHPLHTIFDKLANNILGKLGMSA